MYKTSLLIIFIFCISFTNAQDTIIKISNDTILAKISEITPDEIKYKRFNFNDGPTYIESKSAVKMVIYSNGLKETFKQEPKQEKEPITIKNDYYNSTPEPVSNKIDVWGNRYRHQNKYMSEREMQELLLTTKDKKIISLVGQAKDAKNLQFVGFAGIPLGIASVGFFWKSTGIFSYYGGNPNGKLFNQEDLAISAICGVAAIACPVIAIVSKGNRKNYNRQAIKMYNEKF